MAAFSPKSRYVLHASTEKATDRKRREVVALTPAEVPVQVVLGEHLKKDHQGLDHLAPYPMGTALWVDRFIVPFRLIGWLLG